MHKIETQEAAQRLATAILSDIHLYNAEVIANGGDLSEEIEEGRALFRERVVSQWHPLFEQALASNGLRTQPSDDNAAPDRVITTPVQTGAPASRSNLAWLAFGALGLTATVIWRLLR